MSLHWYVHHRQEPESYRELGLFHAQSFFTFQVPAPSAALQLGTGSSASGATSQQAVVLRQSIEWPGRMVPAIRMPTESQKTEGIINPLSPLRLPPHGVHVFMKGCWSPSSSLRWHAWLGIIVDTRNLFSRFTCLRSIAHGDWGGGAVAPAIVAWPSSRERC